MTTITTATQYANEVPRTFVVTYKVGQHLLPVQVIATRATAHDNAVKILRARIDQPTYGGLPQSVEVVRGPIGAEAVANNDSVVPPLNKRKVRS
jgi:hypothetical protein